MTRSDANADETRAGARINGANHPRTDDESNHDHSLNSGVNGDHDRPSTVAVIVAHHAAANNNASDTPWPLLVQALTAHWQGPDNAPRTDALPAPTWTVTTRYYTARVKPALILFPSGPAHEVPADAEALVVATALDGSMSADRVAALVATWPWTAWDAHSAETKLVISTLTDGSSAGDAVLEDAAQEHGFETVFWRQTEPRDQWDRVGLARVIETLEATMWRSMRVHGVQGDGSAPRLAGADVAHLLNGVDHCDDASSGSDDAHDTHDAHDADAPAPNTALTTHPACDDDADDDDWCAFHAPDHPTHLGPDPHANDFDRDLDALDAVFARLAHVRATPHDADPAHRRAAADSAMRALWGVLGNDSDEEDLDDVFAIGAWRKR
ncbi:hypothetical protein AMAG_06976 [Allomyces macrogynus ATCC 38327]|uniref:Uncharacterized protein n=1 Tax=Allomyces macrogynus (strain ATCC 38327) TaxID=578462 RepID=A0A0L0SFJ6_ALLM3|nr:hypothetical protein AMAG_06976 [Allomyces macrogynus ATCC 38327]|eukprot:KNE61227.1 hypothetical protein AMAG_06976 [Allomyces macrogynus ATCC 38327]